MLPIQSSSPTVVRRGIKAWKTCAFLIGQAENTTTKVQMASRLRARAPREVCVASQTRSAAAVNTSAEFNSAMRPQKAPRPSQASFEGLGRSSSTRATRPVSAHSAKEVSQKMVGMKSSGGMQAQMSPAIRAARGLKSLLAIRNHQPDSDECCSDLRQHNDYLGGDRLNAENFEDAGDEDGVSRSDKCCGACGNAEGRTESLAGEKRLSEEAHLISARVEPAGRVAKEHEEHDRNAQQQGERQHHPGGTLAGYGLGAAIHLNSGKSLTRCVG